MKIETIRKNGFYTDGKRIFYKDKRGDIIAFCKDKEGGMSTAYFWQSIEVEKAPAGDYYDGELKVIDFKNIELNTCTYNYFWKEFKTLESAEKYAIKHGVEVFNTRMFEQFKKVELKKNEFAIAVINYIDLIKGV